MGILNRENVTIAFKNVCFLKTRVIKINFKADSRRYYVIHQCNYRDQCKSKTFTSGNGQRRHSFAVHC